ncbi:MAG: 3-carboxy-cis,cis-muconate cycloisomerase [Chloroflexota bacterium]|nr:3-carboxy-cis,cis-muconate cycloisomerase [Chloroflexota bacterium]
MIEPIDALFSTPEMAAAFSPQAHVRSMLAFEAALARAEARAGVIPQEAASSIAASCRDELFDIAALYREAALAGTPAIPLVRMLTARVEGNAQKFVHWGATSQDAIDTALMLQMRAGIDLLVAGLLDVCAACATLAEQHRRTPMVGRTLLQQALPMTFGLKAARWLALATRQVRALRARRKWSLAVQLGGAAGTLASLGDNGPRVIEFLAEELKLPAPDLPWHTERDRVAEIAGTLGVAAGAMAKIASDIVLLAQTEVGEAIEGAAPGKGGSSALPHKHNPVDATNAIAAARLAIGVAPVLLSAMIQEHERAAGGWQAEWAAIPDLFRFTAGAVAGVRGAVAGLQINAERMKANLDLTHGLIMAESLAMALAPHMGRPEAYRLVQALCDQVMESEGNLHQVALEDVQVRAALSPEEIEQILDPTRYVGSTDTFIDRALDAYRAIRTA